MASKKSGKIDEQTVINILQRYKAETILLVLQEIANFPANKINWNFIAHNVNSKLTNTKEDEAPLTGIELQLLWRHLAYCNPLIKVEGGDLDCNDDDSDIEFELEDCSSENCFKEAVNCVEKLAFGITIVENKVKKKKQKIVKR